MQKAVAALLLAAAVAGGSNALAQAPKGPIYAIVHVDLAPGPAPPGASDAVQAQIRADTGTKGIALMHELAAGCTPQAGCLRFDVLQQTNAPNHITLIEVWKDVASMDFYDGTARSKSVRERLQPMLGSPFDIRLHYLMP